MSYRLWLHLLIGDSELAIQFSHSILQDGCLKLKREKTSGGRKIEKKLFSEPKTSKTFNTSDSGQCVNVIDLVLAVVHTWTGMKQIPFKQFPIACRLFLLLDMFASAEPTNLSVFTNLNFNLYTCMIQIQTVPFAAVCSLSRHCSQRAP